MTAALPTLLLKRRQGEEEAGERGGWIFSSTKLICFAAYAIGEAVCLSTSGQYLPNTISLPTIVCKAMNTNKRAPREVEEDK